MTSTPTPSGTSIANQAQAEPPSRSTPYGHEYFRLRGGLANSRVRFETEKVGRVAFLGGSITAMSGWRDQVCDALRRRFPGTEFEFINAGVPSLGSTPGAFRLRRDVLSHGRVDLLFVEAAVNDETNGQSPVEQVRGMEGIVRQARTENPAMDLVLLHFVDPSKLRVLRQGKTPTVIAQHEKVARRYRIPSIDLAREVYDRIRAGEFTWEGDFKDLHPSPFGHTLYTRSIERLFTAAWKGPLSPRKKTRPYPLPPPLDEKSYFHARMLDVSAARLGESWRMEPKWRPTDGLETRAGFVDVPALVAERAGATLRLPFQGMGVGIFIASGPDAGQVEYRIDGGPVKRRELFTEWSLHLHLPWAVMLEADLTPGNHELELRLAPTAHPESRGHAARILYFLVNGQTQANP